MRPITIFEADDGTRFNTAAECLAHERLAREVAVIVAPLGDRVQSLPANRYVQHNPQTVHAVRIAILRKASEVMNHHWFAETIERAENGEYIGIGWGVSRIIDEHPGPIANAWWRVCVIDTQGREWNQPYYVANTPQDAREWKP